MAVEYDDDDSILAQVRPHGWDPQTVTAYEVAVDLLNQVVGVYSARIAGQRDPEAIASLREAQGRYIETRKRLRPGDRDEVARIRQECAAIIREFGAHER